MKQAIEELKTTLHTDVLQKINDNIADYRDELPQSPVTDDVLTLLFILRLSNNKRQQKACELMMVMITDFMKMNAGLGPNWPSDEARMLWYLFNNASDFEKERNSDREENLPRSPVSQSGKTSELRQKWMYTHDVIDIPIHRWEKKGEPPRCIGPITASQVSDIANAFRPPPKPKNLH